MSRSYCSYDEEWQRKKALLIRSLFHDVPILSPITEESTFNQTSNLIQHGDAITDAPFRCESPLPPLIIEKVSYRQRHDEPEEYYQKLLPKIRRLYRKLFVEQQELSSEDYNMISTNSENIIESYSADELRLDLSDLGQDNSNMDQIHDASEGSASIQSDGSVEAMDDVEEFSSDGIDYQQVTTTATIHADGLHDAAERESRVYEDSVRSIILPTRRRRREDELHRVNAAGERAGLEDNDDPASTTTPDTEESVEVMRTPHTKFSQESMAATRHSDSEQSTPCGAAPQHLTDVTTSDDDGQHNVSEHKSSNENDIWLSLFDKSVNMDENTPNAARLGRKRRYYEDMSVQTSDRPAWEEVRGSLFVGTPKIFKLCSCADHICDSIEQNTV